MLHIRGSVDNNVSFPGPGVVGKDSIFPSDNLSTVQSNMLR